jgi:hypothetical protein
MNTKENKEMKRLPTAVLLVLAATAAFAATDAQKSYDTIKALQGSWEGKNSQGKAVKVSFSSTANNSAVLSEIRGEEHGPDMMVTMFHMDGPDRLLMTHYCSAGNQPRMMASASPDGKTLTFTFIDATNLASPEAGHMQRVVFTITDGDHHIEEWHFIDHGKEMVERFDLEKKS